ncbi:MAG: acetate kinase [Ignavibacteria bacterium]|nr:acetate kinase [Ignavibacteria bacterium]
MKVLVLNCGSSSIKYQFIDTESGIALAKGMVERIGMSNAVLNHTSYGKDKIKIVGEILDHTIAIKYVIGVLLSPNHGVIKERKEIDAIGHRVVHGGEVFSGSVLITDLVIKTLKDFIDLAPLHNPPNIRGIEAAKENLPGVPQCAVFDTAFHTRMPEKAFLYGIPYELYTRHKIRRYGFHGTSHKYVAQKAAEFLEKPLENLKLITIHLGNGASITAVENGISVDTSMGFTPLEGLLMGTRSGDLDPSVILFIMDKEGLNISEANTLLNKHSGLMGLSGESSDMREIEQAVAAGNKRAKDAFDVMIYKIKKYIGAYIAALGGCDAIVFTGGIGENSVEVRRQVCENMSCLGIELDEKLNLNPQGECDLSAGNSKIRLLRIPTNEELVIARDTQRIISEQMK